MTEETTKHTSVWTRPPRKERPTLKRKQIVTKALEILDTEGFEALSMRKLAAELGSGTTSLYWHVANRDELMELIIDEVYGEIELPDPALERPWRTDVEDFARNVRETILRHSWSSTTIEHLATAHLGPNVVKLAETMLTIFVRAGWDLREGERALSTLSSYVTGTSITQAAWSNRLHAQGISEKDWAETEEAVLQNVDMEMPKIDELVASYRNTDFQKQMNIDFEFGLARVLDGLQVHLDSSR
jgi:AcrR family transcriptional regulator